jgi:uncharacterized protein (TIGR03435 family)
MSKDPRRCNTALHRFVLILLTFFIATSFQGIGTQSAAQIKVSESAPGANLPEFEVASIKPSNSNIINALFTYPGGRVVAKGATLQYLLTEAFFLEDHQIIGGPSWIKEIRFDIEAKPSESIAMKYKAVPNPRFPPCDEQRKMLQNLLIQRFQLRTHFVLSTGLVYVLTTTGRTLRLQTPKDPNEFHWAGGVGGGLPDGDGLEGTNISMPELSERLGGWLKRPVQDHTGLTGLYDFVAKLGDEEVSSDTDIDSSIFTALKLVGLELKKSTGEARQLVVDSVSPLSEN